MTHIYDAVLLYRSMIEDAGLAISEPRMSPSQGVSMPLGVRIDQVVETAHGTLGLHQRISFTTPTEAAIRSWKKKGLVDGHNLRFQPDAENSSLDVSFHGRYVSDVPYIAFTVSPYSEGIRPFETHAFDGLEYKAAFEAMLGLATGSMRYLNGRILPNPASMQSEHPPKGVLLGR